MITIISSKYDKTTSKVLEWLLYYKAQFNRINGEELIKFEKNISNEENSVNFFDNHALDDVNKVWFRRGNISGISSPFLTPKTNPLSKAIGKHLTDEYLEISDNLMSSVEKLDNLLLSSKSNANINKLYVLENAVKSGLTIPATIITNSKESLRKFLNKHNKCIIKSIYNNFSFESNNKIFTQYTSFVEVQDLSNEDNDYVFPSMVQEHIDKLLDIRIFVCINKIYSMAIFSQTNPQTKLDFKNYDRANFNRCTPFQMPKKIEYKILKLMKRLRLRTGSIDFVYGKNRHFYFLEVNPLGQFNMVSMPCNYYLEKLIAETLCYGTKTY